MTVHRLLPALAALAAALAALALAGCGGSGAPSGDPAEPAGATPSTASPHPVAGDFEADATALADCERGSASFQPCLEQAYGNLAFTDGPRVALDRFAEAIASDPDVERGCHRIAHTIGSAALARTKGDVGQAFAEGDSTCWSGYYHGILERALKGATEESVLVARVRALCKDVLAGPDRFVAYQCVHGLGHGLMIRSGLDLPGSLELCTRLETPWEQTSCDGGVFMENFNTSYGVTSRFLRDDEPLYPCTAVEERHKLYCYLQITDRILQLNGYDFAAAGRTCLEAEPDWVSTCFQSYGRSASGTARLNHGRLLHTCALAPERGQSDCIYGAIRDIASNDAGGARGLEFCGSVTPPHKPRCYYGLGTILTDLGRLGDCDAAPAAYRPHCRLQRSP